MQYHFRECPTCARKPGSANLCTACYENRCAITELNKVHKLFVKLCRWVEAGSKNLIDPDPLYIGVRLPREVVNWWREHKAVTKDAFNKRKKEALAKLSPEDIQTLGLGSLKEALDDPEGK